MRLKFFTALTIAAILAENQESCLVAAMSLEQQNIVMTTAPTMVDNTMGMVAGDSGLLAAPPAVAAVAHYPAGAANVVMRPNLMESNPDSSDSDDSE